MKKSFETIVPKHREIIKEQIEQHFRVHQKKIESLQRSSSKLPTTHQQIQNIQQKKKFQ